MADSIIDEFVNIICDGEFPCILCPFDNIECDDGLFVKPCLDVDVCKKMLKEHYHITTNDSNTCT